MIAMDRERDTIVSNTDLAFSQWKTCVSMADAVSSRRDNMNSLFVTVNLGLLAAVSFLWSPETILLLLSGIIVCVLWIKLLANYRALNAAKYVVIHNIEKQLPFQAFKDEWEIIQNDKRYTPMTRLEKVLPIAFILIYVCSIIILAVGCKQDVTV